MEYFAVEGGYIAEVADNSAPFMYRLYTLNGSTSVWDESGLTMYLDHVAEYGAIHNVGVGVQFAGKRATARLPASIGPRLISGMIGLHYSPERTMYKAVQQPSGWRVCPPTSLKTLHNEVQVGVMSPPLKILHADEGLTHVVLPGPTPGEIMATNRELLEEYLRSAKYIMESPDGMELRDSILDSSTEVAAHPCTCSDFQVLHYGCTCGGT